MSDIFKIVGIYMGIIIGAGFASGQEILSFFIKYSEKWIFGMIFSGVIFSIVGGAAVKIIYDKKIKNSYDFFSEISGEKIGFILDIIVIIFNFVLFIAMYSASGAFFSEGFQCSRIYGAIIIMIVCIIVFCFGEEGVAVVNGILSPIILFLGMIICLYICIFQQKEVFLYDVTAISDYEWILSALIYSSYNIITGISALTSSSKIIQRNKNTYKGGIIGGFGMCMLGILTGIILYIYRENIFETELPLLAIVDNSKNYIKILYFIMIWSAIISTALGNGYAFISRISDITYINKIVLGIVLSVLGIIFTYAKFTYVVESLYSIFGFSGIFMIFFVIIYILKKY